MNRGISAEVPVRRTFAPGCAYELLLDMDINNGGLCVKHVKHAESIRSSSSLHVSVL